MATYPARFLAGTAFALRDALVRVVAWTVPLVYLLDGDASLALFAAQAFGAADGFMRWVAFRNARSIMATSEGVTIFSGLSAKRIAWGDVLAVETRRRAICFDFVALHYRDGGVFRVAGCFDQFARAHLVAFFKACGLGMRTAPQQLTMTVAGLEERGVWMPLLRRFVVDVAVPSSVAVAFGLFGQALPLALQSASLSSLLAALAFSLCTVRYVSHDGVWYRETRRGQRRLRTIPPPLWLWSNLLAEDAWWRAQQAANR